MITNYKFLYNNIKNLTVENSCRFINLETPKIYKNQNYINLAFMRKIKNLPIGENIIILPEITGVKSLRNDWGIFNITNENNGYEAYARMVEINEKIKEVYGFCRTIGDRILSKNICLEKIHLPNLKSAGELFLYKCEVLKNIEMPKLRVVEDGVLFGCENLETVNLPKLLKVGDHFLAEANSLLSLKLENIRKVGDDFLRYCISLTSINLPKLETSGSHILSNCYDLLSIELPNIRKVGYFSLSYCDELKLIEVSPHFRKSSISDRLQKLIIVK